MLVRNNPSTRKYKAAITKTLNRWCMQKRDLVDAVWVKDNRLFLKLRVMYEFKDGMNVISAATGHELKQLFEQGDVRKKQV